MSRPITIHNFSGDTSIHPLLSLPNGLDSSFCFRLPSTISSTVRIGSHFTGFVVHKTLLQSNFIAPQTLQIYIGFFFFFNNYIFTCTLIYLIRNYLSWTSKVTNGIVHFLTRWSFQNRFLVFLFLS